jgi:hypothetical protein
MFTSAKLVINDQEIEISRNELISLTASLAVGAAAAVENGLIDEYVTMNLLFGRIAATMKAIDEG